MDKLLDPLFTIVYPHKFVKATHLFEILPLEFSHQKSHSKIATIPRSHDWYLSHPINFKLHDVMPNLLSLYLALFLCSNK